MRSRGAKGLKERDMGKFILRKEEHKYQTVENQCLKT